MDLFTCMRQYIAIVEHHGFSAAARHLRVNPPTLSKHLSWLENEYLKTPLLERTTRKINLTAAGTAYYHQVKKIVQDIEHSKQMALNQATEPQGGIVLAAPIMINNKLLLPHTAAFLQQYPKINICFQDKNHPTAIIDGNVDIVVSPINVNTPQLTKTYLLSSYRQLFASPAYIKQHGIPKTLEELQQHNCLINKSLPSPCSWTFDDAQTIEVSGQYQSTHGNALVEAAVNGIGIIWTNKLFVQAQVNQGLLQHIPCPVPCPKVELYLYHAPTVKNNVIRIFAEYLAKKLISNAQP